MRLRLTTHASNSNDWLTFCNWIPRRKSQKKRKASTTLRECHDVDFQARPRLCSSSSAAHQVSLFCLFVKQQCFIEVLTVERQSTESPKSLRLSKVLLGDNTTHQAIQVPYMQQQPLLSSSSLFFFFFLLLLPLAVYDRSWHTMITTQVISSTCKGSGYAVPYEIALSSAVSLPTSTQDQPLLFVRPMKVRLAIWFTVYLHVFIYRYLYHITIYLSYQSGSSIANDAYLFLFVGVHGEGVIDLRAP